MPRESNPVKTKQITVSTTEQIHAFLQELTLEGLHGRNVAETANILISERIRELRKDGELNRRPNLDQHSDE